MASTAKPRFGDLVENGWASEENPTRRGFFVREIRNGARRTWEITDGNGKFWRCPLDSDHKLTWAPAAPPPPLEGAGRGEDGSSQSQPVSALLGADCEPCAICGALPCDQTTSTGKRGPYQGYRWGYAKIDGRWCVGMLGNLDTIHDAQVIVNNHSQSDVHGEAIARTVARRLNGND